LFNHKGRKGYLKNNLNHRVQRAGFLSVKEKAMIAHRFIYCFVLR